MSQVFLSFTEKEWTWVSCQSASVGPSFLNCGSCNWMWSPASELNDEPGAPLVTLADTERWWCLRVLRAQSPETPRLQITASILVYVWLWFLNCTYKVFFSYRNNNLKKTRTFVFSYPLFSVFMYQMSLSLALSYWDIGSKCYCLKSWVRWYLLLSLPLRRQRQRNYLQILKTSLNM